MSFSEIVSQNKEYIDQAAKKLELVKLQRTKSSVVKTSGDVRNSNRWVVAKSWNPCPLGMLPGTLGSSSCIPVLDRDSDCQKDTEEWKGRTSGNLTDKAAREKPVMISS
ncbi:hypothetical protein V6N13_121513 [Hibiscus sabdariffa]|uniref:Uncharacterized protein n=2 Tax=Hibiscus sabdariffa TaxID=183260 RepID=A0ABR2AKB5_9ROSI